MTDSTESERLRDGIAEVIELLDLGFMYNSTIVEDKRRQAREQLAALIGVELPKREPMVIKMEKNFR